jgi:GMP synthase (glutamine-hydrolysing)
MLFPPINSRIDTPDGIKLLKNFAVGICKARQNWTMKNFVDQEIVRIRKLVGDKGQVLGAVSGGVDSTVAAKLKSYRRPILCCVRG